MNTKEHILFLLENNRGKRISGEHIASQLNVSRNAIWKAINDLRNDGYRIDAVTHKGYCLCEDNDILSVQGMLPFLSPTSGNDAVSENIIIYHSLESTNTTAKELAISGAKHGTVVIADFQTAGKGRYGRNFHSPPGCGVYMSFILHPEKLKFENPTLATALAAISVCEAVETVSEKTPGIKWVNDIYLDKKKICGILTEAVTDFESGSMQWIVVGIGINFKAHLDNFPEDLRQIASSVFPDGNCFVKNHPGGNQTVTRNQLASEVVNRMLTYGSQYSKGEILTKYKNRLMMLGQKILVTGAQETYDAVAIDIDDNGQLIVKKENGEIRTLFSGEISIRI